MIKIKFLIKNNCKNSNLHHLLPIKKMSHKKIKFKRSKILKTKLIKSKKMKQYAIMAPIKKES